MNLNEETARAEDLVRRHGCNAAVMASDAACLEAMRGDERAADKWRRVMVLIAEMPWQSEMQNAC